jgi:DNA (cytosine-5)-methyltransferase 1
MSKANHADTQSSFLAVDLFCGSGAVSSGLKAEGFRILAAVDNDSVACRTYSLNHPEVELIEADIKCVDAAALAKRLKSNGKLDLLVVCAPCQPFSTQNRQRANSDPRTNLIIESVKFVEAFKPKVVFIENVPGLITNGPVRELKRALKEQGYFLSDPLKLDSADLGVPQRRERCILIAVRDKTVAKAFGNNIQPLPRKTVFGAIGHLPPLKSGEACPTDPLHRARKHHKTTLVRLNHIPKDGGSRSSLPPYLQLACHKNRKNDFPDVYGRVKWNDVAPTLTTGCTDVTKGRFAHPRDDRALTLREAALLQSFPADYKFHGNSGQIARQIGNAVPVRMVRSLSHYIKEAITDMTLLLDQKSEIKSREVEKPGRRKGIVPKNKEAGKTQRPARRIK